MTVWVKYWPRVLNDQPRSTSPASRTTRPAAKATAPGRIVAAGTTCGARLTTAAVAIRQAKTTIRPPTPATAVAPCPPRLGGTLADLHHDPGRQGDREQQACHMVSARSRRFMSSSTDYFTGGAVPGWFSLGRAAFLEQVRQFAAVAADVEFGIVGEPGGDRVEGGADRHRHDVRVEVGPELTGPLEVGEQLPERGDPRLTDGEVVQRAAVSAAGVERDPDDREDMVAVLAHKGQVGLDVGPEHARAGRLRLEPGARGTPGPSRTARRPAPGPARPCRRSDR